MTISEVIAALSAIREAHGDIHVLHHDDWDEFLVEAVDFEPARENSPVHCAAPDHVVLTGENLRFRCSDGALVGMEDDV